MAVELLARVHAEIEERIADLRPAVAEYERLTGATDALGADHLEGADPVAGGEPPNGSAPAAAAPRTKGVRASRRSPLARAPRAPKEASAAPRAQRGRQPGKTGKAAGAAEQAIVAALEHGSHTVAELVLVSALSGADIRAGLRPLLKSGKVTRARRDGRAAYALSSAA